MYDYKANGAKELSFPKGSFITILEKAESGWWQAELEGKKGLIPSNFVQELTHSPLPTPPASPSPSSSRGLLPISSLFSSTKQNKTKQNKTKRGGS